MGDWIDRLDETRRKNWKPRQSILALDGPAGLDRWVCPVPRCPDANNPRGYRDVWRHLEAVHEVTIPDHIRNSELFRRNL